MRLQWETCPHYLSEVRLAEAIHRQTLWVVGAVGSIVGLIRLLDAVIK